jgi:molybdopterin synthase sulfur carrier subunit
MAASTAPSHQDQELPEYNSSSTSSQPSSFQSRATFHIYYFASAAEYTGKHAELLPAPLPLAKLFDVLEDRYPGIREAVLKSCGVSVGDEYAAFEDVDVNSPDPIHDGSPGERGGKMIEPGVEVGIIPPVSSG